MNSHVKLVRFGLYVTSQGCSRFSSQLLAILNIPFLNRPHRDGIGSLDELSPRRTPGAVLASLHGWEKI